MKASNYLSWKRLKELAKSAPDLSKPALITSERIKKMTLSADKWKMVYATERVDDEILKNLFLLAKEAQVGEKMARLQRMEVMNYVKGCKSEERMVGHTAMRNLHPAKDAPSEVQTASSEYKVEIDKLKAFLPQVEKYKAMIIVGIGGSYLGTYAIYHALKAFSKSKRQLYFASNVDPDKVASILKEVDLKTTLVAIVSKSGSTLEINAQQTLLWNHFEKEGLNPKEHFVMVTGKGSPMDDPKRYHSIFYMWDFIGGRYSVSSMVGALPLAFIFGIDLWMEFLEGLVAMDKHALTADPVDNLPLLGALLGIWNHNFLSIPTLAIIPYSQAMDAWSLHLQQLFMESNGKSVAQEDGSFIHEESCPVVWGSVGTEGQHSYYQAIHQGTQVIALEFIGFHHPQYGYNPAIDGTTNQEKLLANLFAQSLGLATGKHEKDHNKYFAGNRPNHILLAEKLTAYTLGNLLAYYEHYVAFQGFIWGINSFDQEGVQLGKVLANSIIDLYAGGAVTPEMSAANTLLNEFKR